MFVNRIREMVSFELGKGMEKDVFRLATSVGKKIMISHEKSNFRPSDSALRYFTTEVRGSIPHGDSVCFLCPALVTRQKTSFSNEKIV